MGQETARSIIKALETNNTLQAIELGSKILSFKENTCFRLTNNWKGFFDFECDTEYCESLCGILRTNTSLTDITLGFSGEYIVFQKVLDSLKRNGILKRLDIYFGQFSLSLSFFFLFKWQSIADDEMMDEDCWESVCEIIDENATLDKLLIG